MTPQPLIAVQSVQKTSTWYQQILGLVSAHGGDEYEQLKFEDKLVLQLHCWDAHEHPNLGNPDLKPNGNGILLWFQTDDAEVAYSRATLAGAEILEPIKINPNANHLEFWLRDPNGYVVVVAGPYGKHWQSAKSAA